MWKLDMYEYCVEVSARQKVDVQCTSLRSCGNAMFRQRVDLALGPGLFEVQSALKAVEEMNKMAKPILFMCKSGNRAGGYAHY